MFSWNPVNVYAAQVPPQTRGRQGTGDGGGGGSVVERPQRVLGATLSAASVLLHTFALAQPPIWRALLFLRLLPQFKSVISFVPNSRSSYRKVSVPNDGSRLPLPSLKSSHTQLMPPKSHLCLCCFFSLPSFSFAGWWLFVICRHPIFSRLFPQVGSIWGCILLSHRRNSKEGIPRLPCS